MQSKEHKNVGKPSDAKQLDQAPTCMPQGCAPAHPEHGGGGKDTPPSNTVSYKYNPDYFKPLRCGVDSLYVSIQGELFLDQEKRLESLKQEAQSDQLKEQAMAQIELGGHLFEVKDKGTKFFPYILEDNCFRIQLSRNKAKSMPMAYIKISSEYLTHKSPKDTIEDLRSVLSLLGTLEYRVNVSRIDLFVDFVSSEEMESWNRHAWVTRAEDINQYAVDGHFSGWTIGLGGHLAARLYNKVLELVKSNKTYLLPLWKEAGWNGEGFIWRLEFEFQREILKQLDVQSFDSVMDHLNGLWSYATTQWLKLTLPNEEDTNRSRWPIHPLWGYLSSVDFETSGGALSRTFSPQRIPSDRRLFDHAFSNLSSFMAREGITDFYDGAEVFITALYHYLNNQAMNTGASFDDYVGERIAVKAKRFNSIKNKLEEDISHDAAEEYRRQSDGE